MVVVASIVDITELTEDELNVVAVERGFLTVVVTIVVVGNILPTVFKVVSSDIGSVTVAS